MKNHPSLSACCTLSFILALLSGIAFSEAGPANSLPDSFAPLSLYEESYALVIGIDDYNNGWPRLANAVEDAQSVASQLREHGYTVDLKTNLDSRSLKAALRNFFIVRGANANARLLLWFAGHGQTVKNEGFLVASDTPNQANPSFKLSAIHMRDFGSWVRLAESKHVLAIFDSCFSGTIFSSQRGSPPAAITQATTFPVRQFITSGDANQLVSDNGTFRELFTRALAGKEPADVNNDGYLTASELGFFLSDRVTNLTQAQQTPRYGKLRDADYDRGDFILTAIEKQNQLIQETAKVQSIESENLHWKSAIAIDSAAALKAYLSRYPNGNYTELALARLKQLETTNAKTKAVTIDPVNSEAEVTRGTIQKLSYTGFAATDTKIHYQADLQAHADFIKKGTEIHIKGRMLVDNKEWLQANYNNQTIYVRAIDISEERPKKSMLELINEAKQKQNSENFNQHLSSNEAQNQHRKQICLRDCADFAYFSMDIDTEAKAKQRCEEQQQWNQNYDSCMQKAKEAWQSQNKLKCEQRC